MELLVFSNSIYDIPSDLCYKLSSILYSNSNLFLVCSSRTKDLVNRFPNNSKQEIGRLFKDLHKEERIIYQLDNTALNDCEIIHNGYFDVCIYYPNDKKYNGPCNLGCIAKIDNNCFSIKSDFSKSKKLTSLEILPDKSLEHQKNELEEFLKIFIKNTNTIKIVDEHIGKRIIENRNQFPETLEIIFNVFKQNIKNILPPFDKKNYLFEIFTSGDSKLEQLNIPLVKIHVKNPFPYHDRFLKTDFIKMSWGYGMDCLDKQPEKVSTIQVEVKIPSFSYLR